MTKAEARKEMERVYNEQLSRSRYKGFIEGRQYVEHDEPARTYRVIVDGDVHGEARYEP